LDSTLALRSLGYFASCAQHEKQLKLLP
jgi:hypothetical protein